MNLVGEDKDINFVSIWATCEDCKRIQDSLKNAMSKHDRASVRDNTEFDKKGGNKLGETDATISNRYFTVKHKLSFMKYNKITQIRPGGDALFLVIPREMLEKEKSEVYRIIDKVTKWRLSNCTIFISVDIPKTSGRDENNNKPDDEQDYVDELIHELSMHCLDMAVEVVFGSLDEIDNIDPETRDREGIARLSEILAGSTSFKAKDNKKGKSSHDIDKFDKNKDSEVLAQQESATEEKESRPKTENELIKLLSENIKELTEDVEKYTSDKVPPNKSKDSSKYDEDEGLANIFDKINDIQQKIKINNRGSDREAAFALFEALASALGEDSDLDNSYSSTEEYSDSV